MRKCFALIGIVAGLVAYWISGPTLAHVWIVFAAGLLSYYVCSVLVVLWTVLLSCTINGEHGDKRYSPLYHYTMVACGQAICMLCKVHWKIEGMDLLPKEPFLLVGNHRSRFDPILAFSVLSHRKLAFISKPENFRIPVVGKMMARNGYIPIDRNHNRNAVGAIEKAVRMAREEDYCIGIYPEGKRNRQAGTLLPFKAGSFKIATLAQLPVVLMSFDGTERIRKNFLYRPTMVRIRFLKVVHPADFADTVELAQWSQSVVAESLKVEV